MSKLNFDAKVKNAVKNIVSKTEIGNVLDLRDKIKKKKKKKNLKYLIQVISLVNAVLKMIMGCKII